MKRFLPFLLIFLVLMMACGNQNENGNRNNQLVEKRNSMFVNDSVVQRFLAGRGPEDSLQWFFRGRRAYEEVAADSATLLEVNTMYRQMLKTLQTFDPINEFVIDTMFPAWRDVEFQVDLIVGFPKPFDAVTAVDSTGLTHVILDVKQFADYGIDEESMALTLNNIITHEMIHVFMGRRFPDMLVSPEYIDELDAIAFNEGFAHLLSFNAQELDDVDWGEYLNEYDSISVSKLAVAMAETDESQQELLLQRSCSGPYFEKFACMSGMFYLAKQWQRGGLAALMEECDGGCRGFCRKVVEEGGMVIGQ